MTLAVVGVDHPNRRPRKQGSIPRRFEIAACRPGEPVDLELEPDNPADPNAIIVLSERGIQIGYVRAERAQLISGYIKSGIEIRAVFQSAEDWGATIRITTDGSVPVLPPMAATAEPEPDWWPDDEWPD
ncbi:HIRAN domain-containing protein [Sphingomonas montanisoli]|uniref:HIRAN domain-containing protein n=1 Tax=Sphingomonas montanisoli TaxID=2606412 RepID=A0A5D9C0N2_9SPHN|nr:HIRAN domain-containing protein [Sphingomonas montanisoli]TZG25209.1 hypothetical protein FYJ91_16565 [Sphingomonas montanisoli]